MLRTCRQLSAAPQQDLSGAGFGNATASSFLVGSTYLESPVPTACSGGAGIRSDFARWAALLDDSPFRSADAPNSRAAGNERSQTAGERQFCRTKCVTRPQLLRMSMSG